MNDRVVFLSIPGLRKKDVAAMPTLSTLVADGEQMELVPSFPCVTCPVQAAMTTGVLPNEHGVVANGFYWRDRRRVEMWTSWNDVVKAPQIWDTLHQHDPSLTSAVWFALHSKGCGADWVCTPAPIHNSDGSESIWCYTKPPELYKELRERLGHFPLQHFWGPLANCRSSTWIADSAALAAEQYRPRFFYIYLPHLDYAAQKTGPDSAAARAALAELDGVLASLVARLDGIYGEPTPLWIVASEYTIVPVRTVLYPNRVLRDAGLLRVHEGDEGEQLDLAASQAWALVDHQFSHVFVSEPKTIGRVVDLFRRRDDVDEVLAGDERAKYGLDHQRAGEVVVISRSDSWQAYYWWLRDDRAPAFARSVDIHRKPGYDPVELHFDATTRSIPLDATLVRGSHGAPARDGAQRGTILSSQRGVLVGQTMADTDVCELLLRQFGV